MQPVRSAPRVAMILVGERILTAAGHAGFKSVEKEVKRATDKTKLLLLRLSTLFQLVTVKSSSHACVNIGGWFRARCSMCICRAPSTLSTA